MSNDDNNIPVLEEIVVPGHPESVPPDAHVEQAALPAIPDAETLAPLLKEMAEEIQEDFRQEILEEILPTVEQAVRDAIALHEPAMVQKLVLLLQDHLPELIRKLHEAETGGGNTV